MLMMIAFIALMGVPMVVLRRYHFYTIKSYRVYTVFHSHAHDAWIHGSDGNFCGCIKALQKCFLQESLGVTGLVSGGLQDLNISFNFYNVHV